ncbi:hypothetical protein PFICI_01584 [Pestalotiopsis fici W106-1]|uniref:Heme haloperoxidase family profile domain-containing protein n=1 Tax=Pestalotiopsis fici (strain W106-1 / CGMCC3.15140) TaxID=1229662 RepID=W3XRC8_PESFW|nr:uncharacterized protein PFICI_01584 [Pestalotiopsis fici W106-1]ETS87756.1 hypothetical protein PFICI_01584 [Pestalotiopsis fici W106-1]
MRSALGWLFMVALPIEAHLHNRANEWQAPQSGDSRSPCPMLNSLANHGFLPRNGLNVDAPTLRNALQSNSFDPDALSDVITQALSTSTTGNSSTFNLADTVKHNVIEHDGSLSRDDYAHAQNDLHFDAEIWSQVVSHFTSDTISIETAAKARLDRIANAQSTNSEYSQPNGDTASLAETAFYLMLLGDRVDGNPPTAWVKIFFEQERLPFAEGFVNKDPVMTLDEIETMMSKISAVQ